MTLTKVTIKPIFRKSMYPNDLNPLDSAAPKRLPWLDIMLTGRLLLDSSPKVSMSITFPVCVANSDVNTSEGKSTL